MVGSSQDEAARAAVDPCASTVGDLVPDHRADEKGPNWSNLKSIADATVNRYVDYLFPHDDAQDRPCDSKWINLRPERGRVVADYGGVAEAKRCGERGGGGRGTLGRPEGHERRQGGALSAHGPRNHDAMARALLQARGRAPHRPLTIVRRPDRGRRRARASSNKARAAREGRSAPPGRTRDALPAHEIRLDSQECDSSAQKDLHHRSAIGTASAAPGPARGVLPPPRPHQDVLRSIAWRPRALAPVVQVGSDRHLAEQDVSNADRRPVRRGVRRARVVRSFGRAKENIAISEPSWPVW